MTLNIKRRVERVGDDAVITLKLDSGLVTVKRETGEKARAMLAAFEAAGKLGVWIG